MTVRIAISMGDPTGIGPEIILKALPHCLEQRDDLQLVVCGAVAVFEEVARLLGSDLHQERVEWVDVAGGEQTAIQWGNPDRRAGLLQVASLDRALQMVLAGQAHALCTAPITKAAAKAAGFSFPGHTEYLAHHCHTTRYVMMLAGPTLRVVPLTGHLPLRQVAAQLDVERIATGITVTALGLRDEFGIASPRLALAALNPHAGEFGMMGDEEERLLVPGLERARVALQQAGLPAQITGPLPADGLFCHHQAFDAVICCYHDQALIPLKMLHRDQSVNITLGLSIVRTSPAHGSAADIAGQGIARAESMIAALLLAAQVVDMRRSKESFAGPRR